MYDKKRLKKDKSIVKDKTISFVLLFIIISKLLAGKKPPEEIKVMAKFNELNERIFDMVNKIKIPKVSDVYKIRIFVDCFKVSEVLNDK